MADPTPVQPAPVEPAAKTKVDRARVLIRSYPKTVFLYPVGLAAFGCGIASAFELVAPNTLGFVFCAILFFNLIVVSFEFRKHAPVVLMLLAMVLGLAGVLLNQSYGVVAFIASVYAKLDLRANDQFYFAIAAGYMLVLLSILIGARLDYWEVRGNEVLHHHGVLGDCERYPASSMRVKKEITDVFEYLLLGSGRLIIYPSGREQAIVLDNVPRINTVEHLVEEMLDSVRVTIEKEGA